MRDLCVWCILPPVLTVASAAGYMACGCKLQQVWATESKYLRLDHETTLTHGPTSQMHRIESSSQYRIFQTKGTHVFLEFCSPRLSLVGVREKMLICFCAYAMV